MSLSAWKMCVSLSVWGLLVWGALSLSGLKGDWGHGICGPWGCGPPLQALLACHLAWIVCLLPGAYCVQWSQTRQRALAIGLLGIASAVGGFFDVAVMQRFVWLPSASEWQSPYFWRRVAFVIVTTVEFPLIEILLTGALLTIANARSSGADNPILVALGRILRRKIV